MTGSLNSGDIIDGRYEINSYIDAGGMQFVYKAFDRILKKYVALKTPKNSSADKRFKRSAVVAAKVNHPNIAKTLDYVETEIGRYLIEELIEGSDLDKVILKATNYVDPYLVAKIFHYLAKGIAASHHVGVIHRDLKPTNVMVLGGLQVNGIKITDFGIAKMAEEELAVAAEGGSDSIASSQTAVGALPYMSPEAIETPRNVAKATDIWSLGAMMFELLAGSKPFGSGLIAVHKIVDAKPPEFPPFITKNSQFSFLANELIALILKCLQKDASDRPTADQLVEHCGKLCYPSNERFTSYVREIKPHGAWGFIFDGQKDIFFHMDSVYGDRPRENDQVWFSKYVGGGAWRAHPVVCLN
jgi:eukaryotic-like serine/threonine-protein kinase